jgi:hypothetical protein
MDQVPKKVLLLFLLHLTVLQILATTAEDRNRQSFPRHQRSIMMIRLYNRNTLFPKQESAKVKVETPLVTADDVRRKQNPPAIWGRKGGKDYLRFRG